GGHVNYLKKIVSLILIVFNFILLLLAGFLAIAIFIMFIFKFSSNMEWEKALQLSAMSIYGIVFYALIFGGAVFLLRLIFCICVLLPFRVIVKLKNYVVNHR
ncbi:MAG: hypothetical protein RR771_10880, partial [Acinetobacter sp.]